jgi:hypothetical protein
MSFELFAQWNAYVGGVLRQTAFGWDGLPSEVFQFQKNSGKCEESADD